MLGANMLRLKDRSNTPPTPPKGFKWTDPMTGNVIYARNHPNWLSHAAEQRVGNGLAIPSRDEMEDQMCGEFSPQTKRDLCEEYDANGPVNRKGSGSILKDTLHSFGIVACWGCLDLAAKMDQWGPDGCEENMTYIVEAMKANAEHRKWYRFVPFAALGIETMVKLAIHKSRNFTETA